MTNNAIAQAESLFGSGQHQKALDALAKAAKANDIEEAVPAGDDMFTRAGVAAE